MLYESRAVLYGAVLIRGLAEMEPNAVIPNALAGLFNGGIFIAKVDFKLKSPKQTIYVGATTAIESLIFGRLVYDIGKAIERKYF